MNPAQQYATDIMDQLRGWAHDWLEGLRGIRQQQTTLNLPVPYPSHPLPVGFPIDLFSLSQRFEWVHEYTITSTSSSRGVRMDRVRQLHGVSSIGQVRSLSLHRLKNHSPRFLDYFAAAIQLGVFEIAGPIYNDAALPFQIDTDLVLEATSTSLSERVPIHLASRVVAVPNTHADGLAHPMRIYELRTSNRTVIRVLGRRWEL
ncbi:hypothetical protein C8R47DRAFT_1086846 [Mycena vitilis]|nr:hypothetical protein C8R47DRAFT_1086846 [Mycena vitilis]